MNTFTIAEEFLLNGEPFKILSGAIHYFRIPQNDWYHSLFNLKALGFNTVETYVPWNLHEVKENEFNFEGFCDIVKFIKLAETLELYVILRPTPYICAEWEFGGLPAWLLEKDCHIRSSDEKYLSYVRKYYEVLLEKVTPLQITQGGPIIMMQVENEYGSYGEDKKYLRALKTMMQSLGVDVPLFTSDGAWLATLRAGSMIEENVLVTGNFGSSGQSNFKALKDFQEMHGKKWPLMCMEFWDGWFNRWKEPIVTREVDELVSSIQEVLELGSINLYMFHGGTNFGFMNGCSARGTHDLPQITSYDYGAPLDEQGNPTEKYYAIQKLVHKLYPHLPQSKPLIKENMHIDDIPLKNKVSLFNTLDSISKKYDTLYPKNMEKLGHLYGYILYRTTYQKDMDQEKFRIIDGRDRAHFYVNGQHIVTQYQEEIGEDIYVDVSNHINQIDILMENMGRVNYGHKLLSDTQRKGIRQGVMSDLHFMLNWSQYAIDFDALSNIDFNQEWAANQPAFYEYCVTINNVQDTYLNVSSFGKGVAFVNGVNLGRFWQTGPTQTLYISSSFLKEGENQIIIFETEGIYSEKISLVDKPIIQLNTSIKE